MGTHGQQPMIPFSEQYDRLEEEALREQAFMHDERVSEQQEVLRSMNRAAEMERREKFVKKMGWVLIVVALVIITLWRIR